MTENVGAAQSEIFYRKAEVVLQTALQTHPLESDLIQRLAQIEYGRATLWGSLNPGNAMARYQLPQLGRSRGVVHGYDYDPPAAI